MKQFNRREVALVWASLKRQQNNCGCRPLHEELNNVISKILSIAGEITPQIDGHDLDIAMADLSHGEEIVTLKRQEAARNKGSKTSQ